MTAGHPEHDRGRDFVPTGRGGAGNAVRSPSRGRPSEDPAEVKAAAEYHANKGPVHAGRGGMGNVRSPSRDPAERRKAEQQEEKEHKIQAEALNKEHHHPQHTGRGGAGNIRSESGERDHANRGREGGIGSAIRSLSRSRSREPRASSGQRTEQYEDKLGAVDESSSTLNGKGSQDGHGKTGLLGKITNHLPGSHKDQSHTK